MLVCFLIIKANKDSADVVVKKDDGGGTLSYVCCPLIACVDKCYHEVFIVLDGVLTKIIRTILDETIVSGRKLIGRIISLVRIFQCPAMAL